MIRSTVSCAVLAALLGLAIGCDGSSSSSNLSTPKAAAKSFVQALENGNAAGAKAAAVSSPESDKAIDVMAAMVGGMKKIQDAAKAKFGPEQAKAFEGPSGEVFPNVDQAQETITGDTATLKIKDKSDAIKLKKVSGQWKVDVTEESKTMGPMTSADPAKLNKGLTEVADDIKAGKYKTAQEAQMAMGMKMMALMGGEKPE